MSSSEYCYVHSFGRIKGIPWWKNGTFQSLFVGIFVAIIICLIQLDCTASRKGQENVAKGVQENSEMLARMRRIDVTDSVRLLQSYPLGYALFVVSTVGQKQIVTPYPEDRLQTDLGLEWDSVRVVRVTDETVAMTPPNISGVEWRNMGYQISRRVNEPVDILRLKGTIVTIEVLEDLGNKGIICVMGFRKGDQPRKFPGKQRVTLKPIRAEQE